MLRPSLLLVSSLAVPCVSAQTAQFDITYGPMPPEFVTAFDHAAAIWAGILVSPVPIKVNVAFFPLGANALGITFPNGRRDFPNAPVANTWYASALANSIAGSELNPGENDIDIYFSNGPNWYTDTAGTPAANQHDFVSVALHELGHGLGFVGLAKKIGAEGSFGLLQQSDFAPLTTTFPWPQLDTLPGIFDRFIQAPTLEMLVDVPNPSTPLGSFFTCNNLNWNGPFALSASGGAEVRIYAPSVFALGSSCVHLNESTYPVNNPNELMTPFNSAGDVNHWPGTICLGILQDIGWTLAPGVGVHEHGTRSTLTIFPNPVEDELSIRTSSNMVNDVALIIDAHGRRVAEESALEAIDVSRLSPGIYSVALRITGAHARFVKQ
ncbi:MAG: T9SS type A sorting domain-containing protein [Flavobacteriales bacterium]|nr:MAG: T9SS type A sorting domain-containing protein [Flavobacteriales bacterium]